MSDELYLEPNRKAQIIMLLVLVFTFAFTVLLDPMIDRLMPSQDASLEELEAATNLFLSLANSVFFIGCIVGLFWAWYFGYLGYRTLKLGSFPPPGTIVVSRTRVRTGKEATLSGYLTILVAILSGLFVLLQGYVMIFLFPFSLSVI